MRFSAILSRAIAKAKWCFGLDHHRHRGIDLRHPSQVSPDGLRAALDLLHNIDPQSLTRLRRHLPGGIAIDTTDSALAWYDRVAQACILGHRHATQDAPIDLALSLVHELCHARLEALGFAYEAGRRARLERICIGREIALARRARRHNLIDPARLEHLRARRDATIEADFDDRHLRHLARRQHLQRLRNLRPHLPRSLRRALILRTRRKFRHLRATEDIAATQD